MTDENFSATDNFSLGENLSSYEILSAFLGDFLLGGVDSSSSELEPFSEFSEIVEELEEPFLILLPKMDFLVLRVFFFGEARAGPLG